MAYITINQNHFKHNLNVIRNHLAQISPNKEIEVAAVLKDNAYGHGLEIMSDLAMKNNIKSVFVKNYNEALKIAHKFDSVTFFYGIAPEKSNNIYSTIHSFDDFDRIQRVIGDMSGLGVELKVNVGMNRNGIEAKDLRKHIETILKNDMRLIGILSHNGYGDEFGNEFQNEVERFEAIKDEVKKLSSELGFPLPRFHSLNSSCTLRSNNCSDDLVRIGIALYGYLTNEIPIESAKLLRPILKLYANRISTKLLDIGERIGYGGITTMKSKRVVSTYDIGYGDGLYRLNGNKALLLPNGEEILPRTSMDCFSCYGDTDEICVMEDAEYVAKVFDTVPYEVLTRLSPFIPRKIIF